VKIIIIPNPKFIFLTKIWFYANYFMFIMNFFSFQGHNGVVWDLDVSFDTAHLVTTSGDNSLRMWDVQTGKNIYDMPCQGVARAVSFSYSGNLIAFTTTKMTKTPGFVYVVDKRVPEHFIDSTTVAMSAQLETNTAFGVVWSHLDDTLVTGWSVSILGLELGDVLT
jgi:translation initiation factor 3 subunit I